MLLIDCAESDWSHGPNAFLYDLLHQGANATSAPSPRGAPETRRSPRIESGLVGTLMSAHFTPRVSFVALSGRRRGEAAQWAWRLVLGPMPVCGWLLSAWQVYGR